MFFFPILFSVFWGRSGLYAPYPLATAYKLPQCCCCFVCCCSMAVRVHGLKPSFSPHVYVGESNMHLCTEKSYIPRSSLDLFSHSASLPHLLLSCLSWLSLSPASHAVCPNFLSHVRTDVPLALLPTLTSTQTKTEPDAGGHATANILFVRWGVRGAAFVLVIFFFLVLSFSRSVFLISDYSARITARFTAAAGNNTRFPTPFRVNISVVEICSWACSPRMVT